MNLSPRQARAIVQLCVDAGAYMPETAISAMTDEELDASARELLRLAEEAGSGNKFSKILRGSEEVR